MMALSLLAGIGALVLVAVVQQRRDGHQPPTICIAGVLYYSDGGLAPAIDAVTLMPQRCAND